MLGQYARASDWLPKDDEELLDFAVENGFLRECAVESASFTLHYRLRDGRCVMLPKKIQCCTKTYLRKLLIEIVT